VSADSPPGKKHGQPMPSGNADYQWAQFDSEAYFQHYYGEPHPDDDALVALAVEALKKTASARADLDVVDIGTGPSLIPFFCALPCARKLTAWEYAECNVAWLEAELRREPMRPQWRHFWNVARDVYAEVLPDDPMPSLRAKSEVKRGSVFDLPERRWDLATMFFCAESITKRRDEFERACTAFSHSVKVGGRLIAAFLARSPAYVVANKAFPVFGLDTETLREVFAPNTSSLEIRTIGMREREVRSGYSGAYFLTGTAR